MKKVERELQKRQEIRDKKHNKIMHKKIKKATSKKEHILY